MCKVRAQPAVVLSDWWWDKVCSVPLLIKVIHNAEAIPSPAREKTFFCNDMKWDDYVLCNITQNNFEINSIRKVRAQPAVVLSDWWWDKVCSVPLLIKVIHNAEAIPSPAREKTFFCNDMKWDDYVLCNITQNNFEINSIRKVQAQPAVVLLDWRKGKVCSDTEYIKQLYFWRLFNVFGFFRFKS